MLQISLVYLPFKSHTAIVHCVSRIFPICNYILINNNYYCILMLYHTPQLLSSQPFYALLPHSLGTTIIIIIMSGHKY